MKLLSFDIEEWFHILDNASTKSPYDWKNFSYRIHRNVDQILELLDRHNQKATFFCLGWVAENFPEIVRKIHDAGGEIGTHSHNHQLVYEQFDTGRVDEFIDDLDKSISVLQEVTGEKIRYYRAPGFSITKRCIDALSMILEKGIEIDSSLFAAKRAHGGLGSLSTYEPFLIETGGKYLKEFPIIPYSIFGTELVFAGGGYFRLFPYGLIRRFGSDSKYLMSYFHPRDFDFEQPRLEGLSPYRKFKTYVGLKGAMRKLERFIEEFQFMSIGSADKVIDWSIAPVVQLSEIANENSVSDGQFPSRG